MSHSESQEMTLRLQLVATNRRLRISNLTPSTPPVLGRLPFPRGL